MALNNFQQNRCENLKYCSLLRLVVEHNASLPQSERAPERLMVKRQDSDYSGVGGGKQKIIITT